MNWEATGAVGEILGATAVVVTLVYLSRQIRQNTNATRSAARQSVTQFSFDWFAMAIDPSTLNAALVKFRSDQPLDPNEELAVRYWFSARWRFLENNYFQYREGVLDPAEWKGSENLIGQLKTNALSADVWAEIGSLFSPAFVAVVEELQSKTGADDT